MLEAVQRLTGQAVDLAVFDGTRAVIIHRAAETVRHISPRYLQ